MDNIILVNGSDWDLNSFEDSERFEDDSIGSWSDTEQVLNWNGWKRASPTPSSEFKESRSRLCEANDQGKIPTLLESSARCAARHFPFEVIEKYSSPIPESLQLRIAFWSFPDSEDDIRLYSCLTCGSNDAFKLGEVLVKAGHVQEVLQIGFHLSGVVKQPVSHSPVKEVYNVAVMFDRGRITSCHCSCKASRTWCEHATALCLHRIYYPVNVSLRAPVSESLSRLEREQLQKFAQYLISELPQQILPTAQRLLDELLSSRDSAINSLPGAPDPTAGAAQSEEARWIMDEQSIRENLKKALARFCAPSPFIFVDMNSALLAAAPPLSLEWLKYIRAFRGRSPDAVWNLLSIVRHLNSKHDRNSVLLLGFVTEECLQCYQMMHFWQSSYAAIRAGSALRNRQDISISSEVSRHASANLMEEIVGMWELSVMSPFLSEAEKELLKVKLSEWNKQVLEAARKGRGQNSSYQGNPQDFRGFSSAISTCDIKWSKFYHAIGVRPDCVDFSCKRRSNPYSKPADPLVLERSMETTYMVLSRICPSKDEVFSTINKLSQALAFHGFSEKASLVAACLASKILSFSFNDLEARAALFDIATITETSNQLCELLLGDPDTVRLAFKIAILGMMIPRQPARTNIEEIKLTYYEMCLYEKVKRMSLREEHLAYLRFKAQQIAQNPAVRGDAVLPLIIATYIFEVLCNGSAAPAVSPRKSKERLSGALLPEDSEIGYRCALAALGLRSSATDQRHPMLCESIRHQRCDLALTLLCHFKNNDSKVKEILEVIISKDRYGVSSRPSARLPSPDNPPLHPTADSLPRNGKDVQPVKNDITFADIYRATGQRGGAVNRAPQASRHLPRGAARLSSDSDSGNGDGDKKGGRHVPHHAGDVRNVPGANRKQSPRKQGRTNQKTQRQAKPWGKGGKAGKSRKASKHRSSRELTESDSGQEMHFSFDQEPCWGSSAQGTEDWDEEVANVECKLKDTVLAANSGSNASLLGASHGLRLCGTSPVAPRAESPEPMPKIGCGRDAGVVSTRIAIPSCVETPAIDLGGMVDEGLEEMPEPDVSLPLLLTDIPAYMTRATGTGNEEDDFNICDDLFQPGSSHASGNALSRELEDDVSVRCDSSIEDASGERVDAVHEVPNADSAVGSISSLVADDERPLSDALQADCGAAPKTGACVVSSDNCVGKGLSVGADPQAGVISGDSVSMRGKDYVESSIALPSQSGASYVNSEHGDDPLVERLSDFVDPELVWEQVDLSAVAGSFQNETTARKPKKGYKAKQRNNRDGRPTIDIQSIESEAYALFELAKSVLSQSQNYATGDVTSPDADCHRRLQMAAFQIGLFALRVHNRASPNWFSRTYSSYVSWVDHQAADIGTAALLLLQEHWEEVLTPSEVVSIACRMAGQGDVLQQRTAAELALSCLPHANTLNSGEITQTLALCRKQDPEMLERACTAVESAGRNGGVHPEILFRIAREWCHLHEEAFKRDSPVRSFDSPDRAAGAYRSVKSSPTNVHPVSVASQQSGLQFAQYFLPVYLTPEQYVQEQMHQQAQEMLSRQLGRSCDFDSGFTWIYPQYMGPLHHYPLPQQVIHSRRVAGSLDSFSVSLPNFPDELNLSDIPRYLQNAYRVGMHALEALSLRIDDRPEVKFAQTPPCTDHVKWLCALAASLGPPYLKNFCKVAYNAVTSPFVLHDIALEAARHFALYNPAQLASHLRSPSVSPIVQKALTMYTELVHHDLVLLVQHGYHDFVELLRRARSAFCMAPGGMNRFNEILEVVKKTYPKKRELWQLLMNGLSKA